MTTAIVPLSASQISVAAARPLRPVRSGTDRAQIFGARELGQHQPERDRAEQIADGECDDEEGVSRHRRNSRAGKFRVQTL
jgi:hypothetical protein